MLEQRGRDAAWEEVEQLRAAQRVSERRVALLQSELSAITAASRTDLSEARMLQFHYQYEHITAFTAYMRLLLFVS